MSSNTPRIVGLICAAGVGARMGLTVPKQYMALSGAPMLVHTVKALLSEARISEIVLVVSPSDAYIDEVSSLLPATVRILRVGGQTRAQSVVNGLLAANFKGDDWVLVHDAARPCLKAAEVAHLIDEVIVDESVAGGLLAIPVADTLKRCNDHGRVEATLSRENLWRAATPQMFRVKALIRALSGDLSGITDESSAMERCGFPVKVVHGRATNIKVTEPSDALLAGLLIGEQSMRGIRVGQGYDSHRLVQGRPLILGGVKIEHTLGLDGHSDADVLLHAVTDAVLGAAALGDIGRHFPPTDMKWKGADSRMLLREAVRLAKAKGWQIVNVDATIIAEHPKLAPHMAAINASVADVLGLELDAVNVKAKTNEKLDAVGRDEAMVAQAVVLMMPR